MAGRQGRHTVEFGQYEPLTRRLHNLLKEYKDGFSVPKELIQNADDAGAGHVCFLYDERQNFHARTNLVSEELDEFQGPALWAYNDAEFTEKDFQNIRKLGGATKEEDTTTVGKFGLGFNSVYNITDLPSFLSGNQAVIFDPHAIYLGKPGLSSDIKRETDLEIVQKWKNQLKPFDGVFGCKVTSSSKACHGTLFRFPLRTKRQAQKSEIKNLTYADTQMREFFKVFAKHAGNLILFTQNVKSVSFYHLACSGKPENVMKLVEVSKTIMTKHIVCHDAPQKDDCSINVLQYSTAALSRNSNLEELQCIDEQQMTQVSFTNHTFNRKCNIDATTNKITWKITWSIGSDDAREFAKSSTLKGLVPLAAVAFPLKAQAAPTHKKEICLLSQCGKGFYEHGHIFCFMPLPITTQCMVHINATFALTSDRRQICEQSSDDTDEAESDWNQVLQTDVIPQAWAYGLQSLSHIGRLDETAYYHLWPVTGNVDPFNEIVTFFYKFILQEDVKVFCGESGRKWCSYEKMVILDPTLRNDRTVGDIAFFALKRYTMDQDVTVIDLPSNIQQCFKNCGFQREIKKITISEEEFFRKHLLPDISTTFLSVGDRDKLIEYALLSSSQPLKSLLKTHRCIPTQPNGVLKMPKELVHPKGQAATLFLEKEEVFPQELFCGSNKLDVLQTLGMTVDELTARGIVQRVEIIQKTRCLPKNLLKYLNQNSTLDPNNRRFEFHSDVQQHVRFAKILPVLQKPSDWIFDWGAGTDVFSSPSELYHTDLYNLVGCCEKIVDSDKLGIYSGSDLLTWTGVKTKNKVDITSVVNQLRCLSFASAPQNSKMLWKLSDICHTVYTFLEKNCVKAITSQKTKSRRNENSILQTLHSLPTILTGQRLIKPQMLAMNLILPLKPYLFEVDEQMSQLYPNFLKAVAIKDQFGTKDLVCVIEIITSGLHGGPLRDETLVCFCKLVQVLADAMSREGTTVADIKLPNSHGHLFKACDLCLNDCDWIHDQHTMFMHPSIPPKDGLFLGVKTKREANLARYVTTIPHAIDFGQREPLTSRLKRILDGYPKDVSILKELLQNADDAGATELMFIKDFRFHRTERIFSDEWKHLQGPALCVFNNSYFTDEDFIGIQSLGEGSKSHDPLKTGQYGVGFNVVYHLTDVPSWMTVGPRTEKTLCVLDPHQQYAPKTDGATPGIQFKHLHDLRESYKDVFPCYLEDSVMDRPEGTLFRFPLRTEAMADNSKISRHCTTISELENMLSLFRKEAWSSMLFLTSVNRITIASVTKRGKLSIEFSVEASMTREDKNSMTAYKSKLKTMFPQPDHEHITPIQIQVTKSLKESAKKIKNWLIVHQAGFTQSLPIPQEIDFFWRNEEIQLLPRGGVAVPLNPAMRVVGKLFCVLPLPKETGLPLHINGHFALGHEARRDLWQGTHDYRVMWNTHIMEAIICPAYIAAIKTLKKVLFPGAVTQKALTETISHYYEHFPEIEKATDHYVKQLVMAFYTSVARDNVRLFPVIKPETGTFFRQSHQGKMKVEWVPVSNDNGFPGYFSTFSLIIKDRPTDYPTLSGVRQTVRVDGTSTEETAEQRKRRCLSWILKDLGMNIIEPSPSIQKQFDQTEFKDKVHGTSPDVVIQFLKSNQETRSGGCCIGPSPELVENTCLKSIENIKLLTEFCKRHDKFEELLIGLPLMVTQSNYLSRFSEDRELIVTKFNGLIPNSADKLLHERLVKMFKNIDLAKTGCLKRMDVSIFSHLLEKNFDPELFRTGNPIQWLDTPCQDWICSLWTFLSTEVEEETRRSEKEKKEKREFSEIAKTTIAPLEEWSLIPTVYFWSNQTCASLHPIKNSKHVIELQNRIPGSLHEVLKKVCLPKLMTFQINKYFPAESPCLCSSIVTNLEDPKGMLEALVRTSGTESHLSVKECFDLLQYFDGQMYTLKKLRLNLKVHLRNLPFFPSLSGVSVSISKCKQVHVVEDKRPYIPKDGLEVLFQNTGHTLIIKHYSWDEILRYLNLQTWTRNQAYSEVIIPNLMKLGPEARMEHLLHIRNFIVLYVDPHNVEQKAVLETLQNVPFINGSDGRLYTASDFYSNRIVEFKAMCQSSDFLPSPYDGEEWHDFMKLIGLKCKISAEDFVQFARTLEKKSKRGITSEIKTKSKLLVEHLQTRQDVTKDGLLSKIKNIRFVLPYSIKNEPNDERKLLEIHSQFENAERLVSFSCSYDPGFYYVLWTCCSMWATDADPFLKLSKQESEEAHHQLGIPEEPCADILVKHLQNVTSSLKEKGAVFRKATCEVIKLVFTDIYHHLQMHKGNIVVVNRLQTFPTVFIVETSEVVPASDVVIDLTKSEEIPGYIFRAPVIFGPFFDLFEALGVQISVSANTYALVLQKLFRKTQENTLHPNEMTIVQRALSNLINCVSIPDKSNMQTDGLYLPNEDQALMCATSLVFNDREPFVERLRNLKLNYFIGFEKFEMNVYTMPSFPQKYSMVMLSSLVEETLSQQSIERVSHSGSAYNFEQRIKSSEFVQGILRICSHQKKDFSQTDASGIKKKLVMINIRQVEAMETVLLYRGNVVTGSEYKKDCFITPEELDEENLDGRDVTVYLSSSRQESSIILKIALAINSMTKDLIGAYTSLVDKMLRSEPEDISNLLNKMEINKYICGIMKTSSTAYPKVGTLIPDKFHFLLDNSFAWFSEGEYVGLDVYDPFADDSDTEDGSYSLPVCVYAIVVKVVDDTSSMTATYNVEVEEDVIKTVSATMMFKFHRDQTNTDTDVVPSNGNLALTSPASDIESILTDIREQLQDAWHQLKPNERDRVRLRLLSQWHPDKNPDSVDLCTRVCQHIGMYIQRLQNGQSLDVHNMRIPITNDTFYNEVTRRTNIQKMFRESCDDGFSHSSCHQATRQKAYPHIGEARRWLRQAQLDLKAASESLSVSLAGVHNWTCYKSHQAAEKALKAVLFTVDSHRADELNVHRIQEIAVGLDPQLQSLAADLHRRAGNLNGMRYPDRSVYPKVPGDVYTCGDAQIMFDLAEKIVNIASQKI